MQTLTTDADRIKILRDTIKKLRSIKADMCINQRLDIDDGVFIISIAGTIDDPTQIQQIDNPPTTQTPYEILYSTIIQLQAVGIDTVTYDKMNVGGRSYFIGITARR